MSTVGGEKITPAQKAHKKGEHDDSEDSHGVFSLFSHFCQVP